MLSPAWGLCVAHVTGRVVEGHAVHVCLVCAGTLGRACGGTWSACGDLGGQPCRVLVRQELLASQEGIMQPGVALEGGKQQRGVSGQMGDQ